MLLLRLQHYSLLTAIKLGQIRYRVVLQLMNTKRVVLTRLKKPNDVVKSCKVV